MTHKKQPVALAESVQAALFTGLITVGAYIAVPLPVSPVPIVLQNFFVLLAALLLPVRWATASVALYLALGAVGLPVFAAARGGLAHFAGPTGGYLIGFLPAVAVGSLIAGAPTPHTRLRHDVAAVTTATVLVYAVGTPWMAVVMDMNAPAALAAGVLPFLPGDALKAVVAVLAARAVRPLLRRSSGPQAGGEDRS
ncbi:MAG: biotin transporter BioY [Spirochaetaceae bacterium]